MGSTLRRLLYHLLVFCLVNVGDRALCAYTQYFPVESNYQNVEPVTYQSYPVNVESPASSLMNTLLTVGAVNGVPIDILYGAQNISPYPQPIMPSIQEIVLVTPSNIALDCQCNQPTPPLFPAQSIIISTKPDSCSLCSPSLISPQPVLVTAPSIPKIFDINPPVTFSTMQPTLSPIPYTTPVQTILTAEIQPVSYSTVQPPILMPNYMGAQPILRSNPFKSPVQTILTPAINPVQSPMILPETVSFTSTSVSTILLSESDSPVQYSTLQSTPFPIIPQPPLGPIPFTAPVQSYDVNSYTSLIDFEILEDLPSSCSCQDINIVAPIEIETEINTIISNVDYVDYSPSVSYAQNYEYVPYSLEINIPIETPASPVYEYSFPPQIPVLPTIPEYVPYSNPSSSYLPIIIQNSKSNSLNNLLLALLATKKC